MPSTTLSNISHLSGQQWPLSILGQGVSLFRWGRRYDLIPLSAERRLVKDGVLKVIALKVGIDEAGCVMQ